MKKVAIFVEGQTEQYFVQELLKQIIGQRGLVISTAKLAGGKKIPRQIVEMHIASPDLQTQYYFMIYDCGNDERVKTDIIDHISSLITASYSHVIGIRDVYPNNSQIGLLRKFLYLGIPATPLSIKIVLAVNEIESWFLAEENHYSAISSQLNISLANQEAGIDITKQSTEVIIHPADTLNKIYQHAGLAYHKTKKQIQRTVNNMDYANVYIGVRARNCSLDELLSFIESIM